MMIAVEHIIDLSVSPAADPALVRYDDNGELEVRSTMPGGGERTYEVVVTRDDLWDIDDEWDGEEMGEEAAALIAEHLNREQ